MRNPPPDGGYGWVVCWMTFLLTFLHSTFYALYGVIYLDIVQYFQVSRADAAWIGAICTLFTGAGGVVYSPLIQRFGARAVGIHAPFLVAIGYVSSAFVKNSHLLFLTLGFLPGLGVSCYSNCSMYLLQEWFSHRRAIAMGIFLLGSSVGAFVWPPFLTFLMEHYSWQGALVVAGGIHLNGLPCMALLRSVPSCKLKPQQLEENSSPSKAPAESGLKSLFKDLAFFVFFFGIFLQSYCHIIPFSYLTTRGKLSGFSDTASALLAAIFGAASGVCRPLAGFLGTWAGTKRILVAAVSMILAGITSALSIFCTTDATMMVYAIIYGAMSTAYLVNTLSCLMDLWDQQFISILTATNMLFTGIGFFLANITSGAVMDATGSLSLIFIIAGCLQITTGIIFIITAMMKKSRIFGKGKCLNNNM